MSENKRTVERCLDGFRHADAAQILACLTDDVVWEVPGVFRRVGKQAFRAEIERDASAGRPVIAVARVIEEGDVVMAEGTVQSPCHDGSRLDAAFCDVFSMRGGRIARLVTYLAGREETGDDEAPPPEAGRRLIGSGSSFERDIGYSRAVAQGDWVFVSGTTGFDYATMTIADGVEAQAEQCLRNVEAALREAGAGLRDVVRVRYLLPDAADFPKCWPALRRSFGDVRPAATMLSAGLADPRMRIEIEVTALKRGGDARP